MNNSNKRWKCINAMEQLLKRPTNLALHEALHEIDLQRQLIEELVRILARNPPLRRDLRFAALVRSMGLTDIYEDSGSKPEQSNTSSTLSKRSKTLSFCHPMWLPS